MPLPVAPCSARWRTTARRLAALRFPGLESDRGAAVRAWPRRRKMTTRRWYYLIPATGRTARPRPRDRASQSRRPARREAAVRRAASELAAGLRGLLQGIKRVAMEYSPGNNIPYVSRVDAGTIEAVRDARRRGRLVGRSGAAVRGGLVRRGADDAPRGVRRLYRIKDRRSTLVRERLAAGAPLTEFDVQQAMIGLVRRRRG